MKIGILFACALVATFGLTVLISRYLIPFLKSKKMGQKILDIGPRWHKSKEGTPTMGGLAFVAASLFVLAVTVPVAWALGEIREIGGLLLVFGYAILNCLIGVIDDAAKFRKGKNQGLTAIRKYMLQLAASCIFLFVGIWTGILMGGPNDALFIPFFGSVLWLQHGWFRVVYYVIALLLLTGIVNAVNLTDGIDGLASSVTLVVGVFYAILCAFVSYSGEGLLLSALMIGGCGGFLVYNFHPAKVFMGDTGSLYLGGFVVGMAFFLGNPFVVLFCGFIYILETLSVMLQVSYFKLTHGKRLFRMSPIHHHFEKCGWSEVKIVSVFSVVTLVTSAAGLLGSWLIR